MSEEERAAVERADSAAAAETEVRPEELSQGTAMPIGTSSFPDEVVEELRAPLDPNRVRRRKGRGAGQFEYLAGHDVKRRANEIFGFGNWGHSVVERELLGAVEVTSQNGTPGWHVGYATTVRVWVNAGTGYGTFTTEGVGYGDGVEYVAAARVTACELAIKESETDALKRAFTDLGDQFGLILYAKEDEKRRIERERSRDETTGPWVRVETVEGPQPPKNFSEALDRLVGLGHPQEDWAQWWIPSLIEAVTNGAKTTTRDLNSDERNLVGQKLGTVVLELEASMTGRDFPPPQRAEIQAAFAKVVEGVELTGPPWRIDPEEVERVPKAEFDAEMEARADEAEKGYDVQPPADEDLSKLADETIVGPGGT